MPIMTNNFLITTIEKYIYIIFLLSIKEKIINIKDSSIDYQLVTNLKTT